MYTIDMDTFDSIRAEITKIKETIQKLETEGIEVLENETTITSE